ncbi:MAG: hypothetical protein RL497_210, partial [Pseudomonadota bacterium]
MYQQFLDQAGTFFKPMQDLLSLNQSTFEALASKQTALVSDIFNDSLAFTQKIIAEPGGNWVELQQAYWEGINQKINRATQDAAEYWSLTQAKVGDMMQESMLSSTLAEITKNMPSVEAAMTSAMKPMETAKIKSGAGSATKVAAVKPAPAAPIKAKQATIKQEAMPKAKAAQAKAPEAKAKAVQPKVAAKSTAQPAAKATAQPVTAAPVSVKASAEKTSLEKPATAKVGGDEASVEKVIRSIMAE